jgi:anti-anti-sigma factor
VQKNVLRIDVSYIDGLAVVMVHGDIDMGTAPTLRVALDQLDGHQHAYIDMANVRFLDSSGIKVLISQTIRMRATSGELHIRNPSRVVRRIVNISGLGDHFFEPDHAAHSTALAV